MYVTIFAHYLDSDGNIPKNMPKEARELASFLALIIDEATANLPHDTWNTDISCFNSKCDSITITKFVEEGEKIWWFCPECDMEGVISDWKGCRWDNIKK